ncbi:hypothetical protein JCM33374_g3136 [Metschnikowia sp. JCM 33374]|nr:hypothetical protein JCM33374_g3136 [Metschnikowia sp. JCM 33374]
MMRIVLIFASLLTLALAELKGCDPSAVLNKGFDVTFYRYPLYGRDFKEDPTFYNGGYKKYGFLKTVTGIETINFSRTSRGGVVVMGNIYGYDISQSNFTMTVGGYFLATQTGDYRFNMYADDGGYLQFGAGQSCCGNAVDDVIGDSFKAEWPATANTIFTLQAGVYYPMKMVFVNWNGPGGLNIRYTAPDGSIVTEMGSQVYQIRSFCTKTTTETWTGSDTRTITRSDSFYETHVVEVPTPTVTVTSFWGGSGTTSTTVTGGPNQTNTVIVALPPVTTTSYWTESFTSSRTITPSEGGQPTVIVEMPPVTTTSYWTEMFTSSRTVTASDGGQPTVVVEMPPATKTSYRTDSDTSTTTITPTDGGQPTLVVEIPQATTTSYWTESYASTRTVTPSDGGQPTVVIELPPVTTTYYWTESFTSSRTVTPSEGGQPTVIVEMPPVTTTSYWTEMFTSSRTVTASDGGQPTVVVEMPPATKTSYRTDSIPVQPLSRPSMVANQLVVEILRLLPRPTGSNHTPAPEP